jgi:hypothetical protein
VKEKVTLKGKKKLRIQTNGKFNDISRADENNKKITIEPLFKNCTKKTPLP